jgi:hypothetical protein
MATVGTVGAPSSNTYYYDALLSTTLDAYVGGGTMFDNIFKDSAFLAFVRMMDAIQKQDGGERIRVPLMYGDNSTVKSYQGYDVIDTTPQDGMTTAFYEWREIAGTITISRREERQNSGDAAIIGLLKSKITQAEMTMREVINTQLIAGTVASAAFVPGNDAKDLNPLFWFLRKDNTANPSAGGNVGNIAASNSWWRHHTAVFDNGSKDTGNDFGLNVTTWKGYITALKRMYNFCSRGTGGSPNAVLFDQVSFESYESALDDKTRYTNTKMADMGFDTVKLRGATCMWDEVVPSVDTGELAGGATFSGTAAFLNTNFYKLIIDSQTDIITTPFVEPENQTAKTAKILFMANAAVSNLRKHGVVYAINQSIAS